MPPSFPARKQIALPGRVLLRYLSLACRRDEGVDGSAKSLQQLPRHWHEGDHGRQHLLADVRSAQHAEADPGPARYAGLHLRDDGCVEGCGRSCWLVGQRNAQVLDAPAWHREACDRIWAGQVAEAAQAQRLTLAALQPRTLGCAVQAHAGVQNYLFFFFLKRGMGIAGAPRVHCRVVGMLVPTGAGCPERWIVDNVLANLEESSYWRPPSSQASWYSWTSEGLRPSRHDLDRAVHGGSLPLVQESYAAL